MLFRAAFLISLLLFALPAHAVTKPLRVVCSFSILADMVQNVGGKAVQVTSIVGPGVDMHSYQPTPDDAKKLADADMIVINGLGFEGWMERLIQASGTHARVIIVSDGIKSRAMLSLKGVPDPHMWQNITYGRYYVAAIAEVLELALPTEAAAIQARTKGYDLQLQQMDKYVRAQFANIPLSKRKVITSHNSFDYFGSAYGITFLSPVGIDSNAEPSASDVARLNRQIKSEHITTIFVDNLSSKKLLEQIARDTGAQIDDGLYSDALSGPYGGAPSYIAMFRNNTTKLRKAMQ